MHADHAESFQNQSFITTAQTEKRRVCCCVPNSRVSKAAILLQHTTSGRAFQHNTPGALAPHRAFLTLETLSVTVGNVKNALWGASGVFRPNAPLGCVTVSLGCVTVLTQFVLRTPNWMIKLGMRSTDTVGSVSDATMGRLHLHLLGEGIPACNCDIPHRL